MNRQLEYFSVLYDPEVSYTVGWEACDTYLNKKGITKLPECENHQENLSCCIDILETHSKYRTDEDLIEIFYEFGCERFSDESFSNTIESKEKYNLLYLDYLEIKQTFFGKETVYINVPLYVFDKIKEFKNSPNKSASNLIHELQNLPSIYVE